LPISERHLEAARSIAARLRQAGLRVEIDSRDEKIGKKIREAQMDKLQYMLVLGDAEIETDSLAVRSRQEGDLGVMTVDAVSAKLVHEVQTRYIAR